MSRSDQTADRRRRRSVLGVGTAAGAAFAAALISMGTAPSAGAVPGTDLDPYEDLFGNGTFNAWTTTADTDLGALAGGLDTSVDNFFQTSFPCFGFCVDEPFTLLAESLDPSAFNIGGPDNAIGDLAVGLDYTLFASGLGPVVDVPLDFLLGCPFACI